MSAGRPWLFCCASCGKVRAGKVGGCLGAACLSSGPTRHSSGTQKAALVACFINMGVRFLSPLNFNVRHTCMWEGQATSRLSQQLAGVALAVVSFPFASLGAWGVWSCIVRTEATLAIVVTTTVSLLVGLFGLTIAYRIFYGRGVRKGGGVMSPFAFRVGGFASLALAAFFTYETFVNGKSKNGAGVCAALFLAFIFFVAARHRDAMRSIK